MKQIRESAVQAAEYGRIVYRALPPAGTVLDDILKPEYWAHVAHKFVMAPHQSAAKIEVLPQDNAWYAEVLVVAVRKGALLVKPVLIAELNDAMAVDAALPEAEPLYDVEFGGAHKWRIKRIADNAVIEHGFASKDEALEAMATLAA